MEVNMVEKRSKFILSIFWLMVGFSVVIFACIFGTFIYQFGISFLVCGGGIHNWWEGFSEVLKVTRIWDTFVIFLSVFIIGLLISFCFGISIALAISVYQTENWAIHFLKFLITFLTRLPCILIGFGIIYFLVNILHLKLSLWMGPFTIGFMILPTMINLTMVFLKKEYKKNNLSTISLKILNKGIINGLFLGFLRAVIEIVISVFLLGFVFQFISEKGKGDLLGLLLGLIGDSINLEVVLGKIITFIIVIFLINMFFNLLIRKFAIKE